MLKSIWMVGLLLVAIPLLWGLTIKYMTKWNYTIGMVYAVGYTAMLAVYEGSYLIGRRLGLEFDGVLLTYEVLLAVLSAICVIGVVYSYKKRANQDTIVADETAPCINKTNKTYAEIEKAKKAEKTVTLEQESERKTTTIGESLKRESGNKFGAEKKLPPLAWLIFAALLVIQIAILIFAMPNNYGDDITYITFVNDMTETKRFYPYEVSTGAAIADQSQVSDKYTYTSYYPFMAVLSILTSLHPLIICKTILPVAYLLMSYGVWYDIAGALFRSKKMQLTFMNLLSLVQLFGCYNLNTVSKRLLLYAWNGKTPLNTIFIPMILLFMWDRVRDRGKVGLVAIFFLMFGMIATSGMSFGMCCIAVGLSGLAMCICKRKFIYLADAFILCIPPILLLGMMLAGI